MYEQFGGLVDQQAKTVTFKLFVPDGERASSQYEGGGMPRITDVFVVGSFQSPTWDKTKPLRLTAKDFFDPMGPPHGTLKGLVYSYTS